MNQNATTTAETAKHTCGTLLTTLAEVGSMWAVHGLKLGKMALATSAETLGKTAQALDAIASGLEKKHSPATPEAPAEPPPAPAA